MASKYLVFDKDELADLMKTRRAEIDSNPDASQWPLLKVYKNAAEQIVAATSTTNATRSLITQSNEGRILRGRVVGEPLGALSWLDLEVQKISTSAAADALALNFHQRGLLTSLTLPLASADETKRPRRKSKPRTALQPKLDKPVKKNTEKLNAKEKKEQKEKEEPKKPKNKKRKNNINYALLARAVLQQEGRQRFVAYVSNKESVVPVHTTSGDEQITLLAESLAGSRSEKTVKIIAYTLGYEAARIDRHTNTNLDDGGLQTMQALYKANIKDVLLYNLHVKFCEKDFEKTTAVATALHENMIDAHDLRQTLEGYKTELTAQKIYTDVKKKYRDFGYKPRYA